MPYRLSSLAELDLAQIWSYVAEDASPTTAGLSSISDCGIEKALRSPQRCGVQVHEQLTIGVECYAGHRGEQTPRTLILGDRRVAVADVVDAWLAPDYRYFKLSGADGQTYLVRHDERSNTWELTMFRTERVRG